MNKIKIIETADGSNTLFSEEFNAHYHSLNGALQESRHIFIEYGFNYFSSKQISVLEVGFGTGLNAALTASRAENNKVKTRYSGIELFPLNNEILNKINYKSVLSPNEFELWTKINHAQWELEKNISDFFSIEKLKMSICNANLTKTFDLIYYDAFAPEDQPELWDKSIFEKIYNATNPEGILVTYCSKGIVKQALRHAGYKVERHPGPIGKRHIIRAIRSK
ncbi:MAG TPA: SAM-dependent methyltransferase [Bacteroidales bacterium]|nr:SAM-dependent methyltransferase [Bacteroidales bacterium]